MIETRRNLPPGGKLAEALEIYLRLGEARGQPGAGLAITYAGLGRKEEARKVLHQGFVTDQCRDSQTDPPL